MSSYLARYKSNELEGYSVRPRKADELVPVPGDHVGDVEPDHEGHWNLVGKSGMKIFLKNCQPESEFDGTPSALVDLEG